MMIILTLTLTIRNSITFILISIQWSEGQNCDKEAMYGPFLQKQGKNNVVVSPWESGVFEGEWCGEKYTEERLVTFSFMKQTIGQTLVEVKHTQRCRRIENDQCIVQIKMGMKGFPYASECPFGGVDVVL